jgi:hypothetical protein
MVVPGLRHGLPLRGHVPIYRAENQRTAVLERSRMKEPSELVYHHWWSFEQHRDTRQAAAI